ncbi:MAG: hypothetical protein M3033_04030 [Acidobacteriota bacterium]|nr:hypothetical protein [Acidobacteriota bacterium]
MLRIVAELQPAALANFSATDFDPTGSPVTRCSLMTADKMICPRASGKFELRSFVWFEITVRHFSLVSLKQTAVWRYATAIN